MKALFIYLLQAGIASGILYGWYHIILRNKKFHQYNRFYLLGSLIIALLIPFLNIPVYFTTAETQSSPVLKTLSIVYASPAPSKGNIAIQDTADEGFNWILFIRIVYVAVATVFLLRVLFSLKKIRRLINNNPVQRLNEIHFVNTAEPGTPFSFFRWLFWNRKIELNSERGQQIFRHEIFHIRQRHSWDLMLMEFVTMIFWINPFFHLIKKELTAIHEFLADRFAMTGREQSEYAELLLMQALQTRQSLVNPFFNTQIKRRIAMITSSSNPGHQYFRKLMVLPVAAVTVLLVAFSYQSKQDKAVHFQKQITPPQTDTPPVKKKAVFYSNTDQVVIQSDTIIFHPDIRTPGSKKMLVLINGEIQAGGVLADKTIISDSIIVYDKNDPAAIKKYGEKAAGGVIIFENAKVLDTPPPSVSLPDENNKQDRITIKDSVSGAVTADFNMNTSAGGANVIVNGNIQLSPEFSLRFDQLTLDTAYLHIEEDIKPELFVVNGNQYSFPEAKVLFNGKTISSAEATIIKPNSEDAVRKYGEAARNGVIELKHADIIKNK